MNKRSFLIGCSALVLIAAVVWGTLYARASLSQHSAAGQPSATATISSSLYLTGSRAIPTVALPSLAANCDAKHIPGVSSDPDGGMGAPAIKPHLCSIPTFDEQDVRQYMGTISRFTSLRIRQTSPHFIVTRILFVTNDVANTILNADTGVMSDKLIVCYVEVYGDFIVESPFGINKKPATLHHGQMVFDSVTGNMLVIGVES